MRVRDLFVRTQAPVGWRRILIATIGSVVTIGLLALVTDSTQLPLLSAVFGASCVLVFLLPEAPVSQPANVVGGHVVSAASALALTLVLPRTWWSVAIAVGVALVLMAVLRVVHPPAGANPIIVMTTAATWSYLLIPVLLGSVVVVILGVTLHRLTGTGYPAFSTPAGTRPGDE